MTSVEIPKGKRVYLFNIFEVIIFAKNDEEWLRTLEEIENFLESHANVTTFGLDISASRLEKYKECKKKKNQ